MSLWHFFLSLFEQSHKGVPITPWGYLNIDSMWRGDEAVRFLWQYSQKIALGEPPAP